MNGTFGHGNMTCWPRCRCLCSGGKNKVNMRDRGPLFMLYGYEIDNWVVCWCTMLVLEPKEKLLILLFKPISTGEFVR